LSTLVTLVAQSPNSTVWANVTITVERDPSTFKQLWNPTVGVAYTGAQAAWSCAEGCCRARHR
jgi:hypothetical protein